MSNYDPEDDDLEAAMSGDQEGDDFANFDPQRYVRRRGRPVVSDDRDEYQMGTESPGRNRGDDNIDLSDSTTPRNRRVRYPSRVDVNELERIRRTGTSNNLLDVVLGVIVGVGGTSGCGRRILILLVGLVIVLIAALCLGGVWLVSRLLTGG